MKIKSLKKILNKKNIILALVVTIFSCNILKASNNDSINYGNLLIPDDNGDTPIYNIYNCGFLKESMESIYCAFNYIKENNGSTIGYNTLVDINMPLSSRRDTLIKLAVDINYPELTDILEFPNIDLNIKDIDGNTALVYAISALGDHRNEIQILLEQENIDLTLTNNSEETIFHSIISSYYSIGEEFALELVPYVCSKIMHQGGHLEEILNKKNSQGKTVLHLAAQECLEDMYNLLVNYGAEKDNIFDDENISPAQILKERLESEKRF